MTAAFKQKERYDGELNKLMEANIEEQSLYIGQCETIMYSNNNALNDLRALVNDSEINRDPMQNHALVDVNMSNHSNSAHTGTMLIIRNCDSSDTMITEMPKASFIALPNTSLAT